MTNDLLPDVIKFLLGEGELEGMGFGTYPEGRPYWWRAFLRKAWEGNQSLDRGDGQPPEELFMAMNTDGEMFNYGFDSHCVKTTRYIRADLVSTPNKPAEVDLDALKVICGEYIAEEVFDIEGIRYSEEERNCLKLGMPVDARTGDIYALLIKFSKYLHSSGHLATGNGGGDKDWVKAHLDEAKADYETWPEWRKEVSRSADKQKTAEPCRDEKPAAYWARYNDGSGKIYEDKDRAESYAKRACFKCTVIPVYTQPQPAAPTQIDAGELERAIWYCREDWQHKDGYEALYEHMDIIIEAARAHLEKLKVGV